MERCYENDGFAQKILPNTMEGVIVRISDVIAYLGKDRQDASRAGVVEESAFFDEDIGSINAEIINNLVVNVIENSYGQSCIKFDSKHFKALKKSQKENYELIYNNAARFAGLTTTVRPMMAEIYEQLLEDLKSNNRRSPIFAQHIDYISAAHYKRETPYLCSEPNQIVVDYIASMTDDYFVDLHAYMFPNSPLRVEYRGYFDSLS